LDENYLNNLQDNANYMALRTVVAYLDDATLKLAMVKGILESEQYKPLTIDGTLDLNALITEFLNNLNNFRIEEAIRIANL